MGQSWHADGSFEDDPLLFDLIGCVVRKFGLAIVRMAPGADVESRRTSYYNLMGTRGLSVEISYRYDLNALVITERAPKIVTLLRRHADELDDYARHFLGRQMFDPHPPAVRDALASRAS